jgi:hypothetical protein
LKDGQWLRFASIGTGEMIADYARRIATITAGPSSESAKKRLQTDLQAMASMLEQQQHYASEFLEKGDNIFEIKQIDTRARDSAGVRPRKLSLIPYNGQLLLVDTLPADDQKWWAEQERRFESESPGGGLPLRPPFAVITFEAVNFMDSKRTTGEIAELLSSEFNQDIDQTWVERLVAILIKLDLVTTKGQ